MGSRSRCTPSRETSGPPPPPGALAAGDLVDLVDEDDARLLGPADRVLGDAVHVQQLGRLLLGQRLQGLGQLQAAALGLLPAGHHVLQVEDHLLHAHAGEHVDERGRGVGGVDLHRAIVQLPLVQHAPQALAGGVVAGQGVATVSGPGGRERAGRRQQQIQQALLGVLLGAGAHPLALLLAQHRHRGLGQIAHHRIDVAADVAHLGELRGLDLHERRPGQPGQAAGDLGLPDAGRADHHDVLGRDLVAQRGSDLLAAPAVAQGHGHGALGGALADDVAIQLLDDGPRGQVLGRAQAGEAAAGRGQRAADGGHGDGHGVKALRTSAGRWCRCRCRRRWPSPSRRSRGGRGWCSPARRGRR